MAEPALLQVGNYHLEKNLGVGAFGKVKRKCLSDLPALFASNKPAKMPIIALVLRSVATHITSGCKVAVKILNKAKITSLSMQEKVRREIHALKRCDHPHIIRLYDVIETPTDFFVVMEYVPNGELFEYIIQKGRVRFRLALL